MEEQIITYIQDNLVRHQDGVQIAPDDDLLGSGLIESLGMVQLIQFLEETFEIKVAPIDMTIENFMSVSDIVKFVSRVKE